MLEKTIRKFTCIMCPQGCDIEAEVCGSEILSITGNTCDKGKTYVTNELLHPMRNIASSILVEGSDHPLVSVRLSGLIPKDRIFDVMDQIKAVRAKAPVTRGSVIIENVLGLGVDVIATGEAKEIL